jgi:ABC-type glycerol-3-phosphate transport system substrate-binding protein
VKKILIMTALICLCGQTSSAVTIDWWHFWTDAEIKPVIEAMVDEFEQSHPDIEVKLTDLTWSNGHEKIVIALASGTGPDVLELGSDWIAQFAANGHVADVSERIAVDSSEYQGWSMATYHGKVFAQPWFLGTRVLFANRALLNQAGYDDDFVPVRQDQFREAVYRVDSLSKDIYGWGSNTAEKHRLYKKYLPFFWTAGAQIFSDDGRLCVFSSMMAIDALRFYKELHDSCGYVATQRGIEDAFLAGKIGFVLSGDWLLKRIEKENRDIDLVSTLFPGEKYPGKSFLGGEFLAVNAASDEQQAALEFIDFITSPENQVRFCKANRSANPSSIEAQKDPYFAENIHLQTFIKQIAMAEHPPVHPNWVSMEAAIEDALEDALFGSGLVAEPLRIARGKIAELNTQ